MLATPMYLRYSIMRAGDGSLAMRRRWNHFLPMFSTLKSASIGAVNHRTRKTFGHTARLQYHPETLLIMLVTGPYPLFIVSTDGVTVPRP